MGYQLTTPPNVEPLSLAEAKLHLRVDVADDDTLITALITAARQFGEQLTACSFCTQSWRYVLDSFPGGLNYASIPFGAGNSLPANAILLEKGPVASIDSIKYLDMSGAQQTLSPSVYTADLSGSLARITPKFGQVWPPALPQIAAVEVAFTAGFGAAVAVPASVKQWMLLRIGAMYENREEFLTGRGITVAELPFVDSLLDTIRIVRA